MTANWPLFLSELDQTIGWDNVLIFLTADHGACDVPGFSKAGGYYDMGALSKKLGEKFTAKYGTNLIQHEANDQLYIDKAVLAQKKLSMQQVYADVREWAKEPWLLGVFMPDENENCDLPAKSVRASNKALPCGRSGDIWVIARPNWLPAYYEKGGTHPRQSICVR